MSNTTLERRGFGEAECGTCLVWENPEARLVCIEFQRLTLLLERQIKQGASNEVLRETMTVAGEIAWDLFCEPARTRIPPH